MFPKEILAVRRAPLLPFLKKRANGPQGADSDGAQHPAVWRASPPFGSEGASCACQRAERAEVRRRRDDQANNVSNEALCVIGVHGSGDKIFRYLQDWEVAKVARCHMALDMPCQE